MEKIIVKRRSDDYHASLEENPGIWGRGKSMKEAVGDVISAHPEKFNLIIEFKG